ncbi:MULTISPECIES: DUF4349 domain-containing protein [Asticcacaulis]|uniref:DUF4349 domain-containing protein n=1 Tax=Asticcacaulis TaxID=76890 RepID=UPI001AE6732D|nr:MULTISPECIES: DUF4349 domain-containing protein [Asticcacaulis]MBP2157602.1 hypothetical protein [Asticcacaulis solisilvae]MDR6798647.1 hypothetical protein [Asticcacaulis sp. BE141]
MSRRYSAFIALAALCVSINLAACSPKAAEDVTSHEEAAPAVEAVTDTAGRQTRVDPASLPQLAYDYSFDLSAPDKQLNGMVEGHQEACTVAGPGTCQILSLDTESGRSGEAERHTLVLRATPQWIGLFRKTLANELKAIGGKIEHQSIATEDLSLSIIDREAHINNQVALRDNLQATLRTHKGKMSEVVDLKQELASIQSDIDAARTAVATMKKRVAMSRLTLTYTTATAASSRGTWAPFTAAVSGIGPNFVSVLTIMVTVFSYLAPLGLVIVPLVWWLRRQRKQARAQAVERSAG